MAPESANRPPKATGTRRSMMAVAAIAVVAEARDDAGRRSRRRSASRHWSGSPAARSRTAAARRAASPAGRGRATSRWIAHRAPKRRRATKISARYHGRDRRAVDAEPEAEDQERVEHGRDDAARQRHIHGALGVADRPQDAREPHAERHERRSTAARSTGSAARPAASRRSRQGASRIERQQRQERRALTAAPASTMCDAGRAGEPARVARARAAPSARDTSAPIGDHQADIDRDGEEQHDRGKPDAGRQARLAEPGNVEQRQEVDDEDGDRARPSPSPVMTSDVAHGRARRRSAPSAAVASGGAPSSRRWRAVTTPSPRMSRVSRDERRAALPSGRRAARGSILAPRDESAPPMSAAVLLQDEPGDVALAHVAGDRRRRARARTPSSSSAARPKRERRFEHLADLVIDLAASSARSRGCGRRRARSCAPSGTPRGRCRRSCMAASRSSTQMQIDLGLVGAGGAQHVEPRAVAVDRRWRPKRAASRMRSTFLSMTVTSMPCGSRT